jgi:hypothetical protein
MPNVAASLDVKVAIETLTQLDRELGRIDPDTRAIVGLRSSTPGTVSLVDVTLRDNGVLHVDDEVAGLIVVTAEEVADDDEVVGLTQLLCILRDGTELGLYRVDGDDEPRIWRTDADPDDAADDLRPRDIASNTARRALGLPSLVEPIDVADIALRTWLVVVASAALRAFDSPDGPVEVSPQDLGAVAERSPLRAVTPGTDRLPTWAEVHRAAIADELDLGGHLTVDPAHARWLDTDAFAQVLDQTLPSTDELLGSLRITGDDDLLAWVIERLASGDDSQPAFV